jgi:phytol kinase
MINEYYTNILIVLFLFFLVFGFAEFLYRRKVASYITRKIVHIGGGLVATSLPVFVNLKTVIILGLGFFVLLAFSRKKQILNSIHKIDEDSIGALLFAPSITLTALIFWPINTLIFQGAALVLGVSDGFAGLIGRKYGRNKYKITGAKSLEGSLSFFLITFFILFVVLYINGPFTPDKIFLTLGCSFLLTFVEAIFGKGWDNIFIPLASGLILFFIL